MATNLTAEFIEGYNAQDAQIDNPYLWSSDSWLAYDAGAAFAKYGYSTPTRAAKSRGYSLRVQTAANDFTITYNAALSAAVIVRK